MLRTNGAADAGLPQPSRTPSESPTTTAFSILSVGDGGPLGQVGEVIRLPPGVDTEEETLTYLQSLANPEPLPSWSPETWRWPGANWAPNQIPTNDYLESRGIDPLEFRPELNKGEEAPEELIERLATK